ncbi:hypothetical protein C8R47DRAFT_1213785 [Mycena vitilis]|nr:hypothetical protein C8R47DRAFT_1213784 [Mycena vitilis]KAJ6494118.1 hypothetical protein C8R47DRAFT_1213785 [Mycena vitilis]
MSEPNSEHTPYQRHAKYYETESRTFVYAIEKTLYHFPLAVLTMFSPPLTAVFGIPPSAPGIDEHGNQLADQGTEKNPIILPGVTVEQMDDFLSYFFKSSLTPISDLPAERLEKIGVNLLTVGCLWDIEEAKTHAKGILSGLQLPACRMLSLARQFAVHEWVDKAVRTLVPICGSLTNDDALAIGPITLGIFMQAKTALDLERVDIAFTPQKLKDAMDLNYGECDDHRACERAWKTMWWNVIAKKILHPRAPMALDKIGETLNGLSIPGMTPKCHEDAVAKWTTFYFEDEEIMLAAVKAVEAFHKCCRPS